MTKKKVIGCLSTLVCSSMLGNPNYGTTPDEPSLETDRAQGACSDWDDPAVLESGELVTAGVLASFFASGGLSPDIVADCLQGGSDPNAIDDGYTPLTAAAAWSNDSAIIEVLLEGGAELAPEVLHFAAHNRNLDVAEALLSVGADVGARDVYGNTALHSFAAYHGNPAAIQMLLNAGADLNARNKAGRMPLSVAAGRNNKNVAVVTALLRAGAAPNATDDRGATALHFAATQTTNPAIVEALIAAGASINARDKDGRSPMHLAVLHESDSATGLNAEIVAYLAKAGADANARDYDGRSPLHLAVRGETSAQMAEALIESGARVDLADDDGRTPADLASTLDRDSPLFAVLATAASGERGPGTSTR